MNSIASPIYQEIEDKLFNICYYQYMEITAIYCDMSDTFMTRLFNTLQGTNV